MNKTAISIVLFFIFFIPSCNHLPPVPKKPKDINVDKHTKPIKNEGSKIKGELENIEDKSKKIDQKLEGNKIEPKIDPLTKSIFLSTNKAKSSLEDIFMEIDDFSVLKDKIRKLNKRDRILEKKLNQKNKKLKKSQKKREELIEERNKWLHKLLMGMQIFGLCVAALGFFIGWLFKDIKMAGVIILGGFFISGCSRLWAEYWWIIVLSIFAFLIGLVIYLFWFGKIRENLLQKDSNDEHSKTEEKVLEKIKKKKK